MTNVTDGATRAVRALYKKSPTAKAAFEYFAERQKNSRETAVERLLMLVRQQGVDVSRAAVIEFFQDLEGIQCGRFVVGRKGHPSRFEWSVALRSLAQAATGEASHVEALSDADSADLDDDAPGADLVDHPFLLRPELTIRLSLPRNLSAAEASRVADFVKTLPFDR